MKIMLVDDEPAIQVLIGRIISDEGWEFCGVRDGAEALRMFEEEKPDLLILDIMMSGMDGFQVCRELRDGGADIPIIFLSAKADISDKGIAFECGGDDYVVKPFDGQELVMRIRAHARKHTRTAGDSGDGLLVVGRFEFNPAKHKVSKEGVGIDLTRKEYEILHLLAANQGNVVTSTQIIEDIWGENYAGEITSLPVLIRRLRNKIEDDPSNPSHIQTIWRTGYRFSG